MESVEGSLGLGRVTFLRAHAFNQINRDSGVPSGGGDMASFTLGKPREMVGTESTALQWVLSQQHSEATGLSFLLAGESLHPMTPGFPQ